jgi:FixJ family two-component response regulator
MCGSLDDSRARERVLGPVRVFIVDDQELARQGLRSLLEGEGLEVVGECGSARNASRLIADENADVAVVDGRLPDGPGLKYAGMRAPLARDCSACSSLAMSTKGCFAPSCLPEQLAMSSGSCAATG